jgi:hypothetical protein
MRVKAKPSQKAIDEALSKKQRTEAVTRIVALVVAFISVFIFFIKLLFL